MNLYHLIHLTIRQQVFSNNFCCITSFNGKNERCLSKTGPQKRLTQPISGYFVFNFESTNGFEYFDPNYFPDFGNVDTTLGINNVFNSLKVGIRIIGWPQ
jgi:hypothetical protein